MNACSIACLFSCYYYIVAFSSSFRVLYGGFVSTGSRIDRSGGFSEDEIRSVEWKKFIWMLTVCS
jgi:hypothetical protein